MGESGTVIGENGRIEPFWPSEVDTSAKVSSQTTSSWRLNIKEFCLPQQNVDDDDHHHSTFPQLFRTRKRTKVTEYYRKQKELLEGFSEMEAMTETGGCPGSVTEDEMKQLARSERMAIHASNIANLVLFEQMFLLILRADHYCINLGFLLGSLVRVYFLVHHIFHEKPKPVSLSNWKKTDATSGKASNFHILDE